MLELIIGRCSGPSVFCEHRDNWFDPTKKALSFTFTNENAHFVYSKKLPMKRLWSPVSNPDLVYEKIKEIIDG